MYFNIVIIDIEITRTIFSSDYFFTNLILLRNLIINLKYNLTPNSLKNISCSITLTTPINMDFPLLLTNEYVIVNINKILAYIHLSKKNGIIELSNMTKTIKTKINISFFQYYLFL